MAQRFLLISGKNSPTRNEITNQIKPIGEEFLNRVTGGGHKCEYAGYIVYEGRLVPQWITNDPSLEHVANIDETLKKLNYIGKLINW